MKAMKLSALVSIATAVGCATAALPLDQAKFYKRDISIKATINGQDYSGNGVLVLPKADKYEFEITAKDRLDLFTLSSCHRELTQEDAGEGGIFGDKKKVKITYRPVNGIENVDACPVELGGYAVSGQHSWGFVDFQVDTWVPAKVKCDGKGVETTGVSICQGKVGLIAQIIFKAPVRVATQSNPACPQLESKDGLLFEYRIPNRRCSYVFADAQKSLHRHTSLGYESILIRNN